MIAVYSIPNQVWMVLFGDTVQEIRSRRFWPSKSELIKDLMECGLNLDAGNKIVLMDDVCSYCSAALPSGGGCKTCSMCGTSTGCC